jgi:hypothetical protein
MKACKEGKERNPITKRCVKKCGPGKVRNTKTRKCVKENDMRELRSKSKQTAQILQVQIRDMKKSFKPTKQQRQNLRQYESDLIGLSESTEYMKKMVHGTTDKSPFIECRILELQFLRLHLLRNTIADLEDFEDSREINRMIIRKFGV